MDRREAGVPREVKRKKNANRHSRLPQRATNLGVKETRFLPAVIDGGSSSGSSGRRRSCSASPLHHSSSMRRQQTPAQLHETVVHLPHDVHPPPAKPRRQRPLRLRLGQPHVRLHRLHPPRRLRQLRPQLRSLHVLRRTMAAGRRVSSPGVPAQRSTGSSSRIERSSWRGSARERAGCAAAEGRCGRRARTRRERTGGAPRAGPSAAAPSPADPGTCSGRPGGVDSDASAAAAVS